MTIDSSLTKAGRAKFRMRAICCSVWHAAIEFLMVFMAEWRISLEFTKERYLTHVCTVCSAKGWKAFPRFREMLWRHLNASIFYSTADVFRAKFLIPPNIPKLNYLAIYFLASKTSWLSPCEHLLSISSSAPCIRRGKISARYGAKSAFMQFATWL